MHHSQASQRVRDVISLRSMLSGDSDLCGDALTELVDAARLLGPLAAAVGAAGRHVRESRRAGEAGRALQLLAARAAGRAEELRARLRAYQKQRRTESAFKARVRSSIADLNLSSSSCSSTFPFL